MFFWSEQRTENELTQKHHLISNHNRVGVFAHRRGVTAVSILRVLYSHKRNLSGDRVSNLFDVYAKQ